MAESCTGVGLTDSCGAEVTHVVPINAPTGYREATHCAECAEVRSSKVYVGDPEAI